MKRIMPCILVIVLTLIFTSCANSDNPNQNPIDSEQSIDAEICEIMSDSLLVKSLSNGGKLYAPMVNFETNRDPEVGDFIRIIYTGNIDSSHNPGTINGIKAIYLLDEIEDY